MGKILMSEGSSSTMGWVRGLLEGKDFVVKTFPPRKSSFLAIHLLVGSDWMHLEWFIDVHDCARVHVAALLDPKVQNERLFAFAEPFNWTDILSALAKLRPGNEKLPEAPKDEGRDLSDIKGSKKAEDLIKSFFGVPGWTSMKDSISAGIVDLK